MPEMPKHVMALIFVILFVIVFVLLNIILPKNNSLLKSQPLAIQHSIIKGHIAKIDASIKEASTWADTKGFIVPDNQGVYVHMKNARQDTLSVLHSYRKSLCNDLVAVVVAYEQARPFNKDLVENLDADMCL